MYFIKIMITVCFVCAIVARCRSLRRRGEHLSTYVVAYDGHLVARPGGRWPRRHSSLLAEQMEALKTCHSSHAGKHVYS